MKLLPATCAGFALVAVCLSSCTTPTSASANHWRIEYVGPRVVYNLFGYDGMNDGSGSDFAKQQASDFGKNLQRMFLNFNPDNPLTGDT
jgi:hypothetical protein